MIRWFAELLWALGFLVLALASWLVEFARCVLLWLVVVPLLVGRVVLAAVDVAAYRVAEAVWPERR